LTQRGQLRVLFKGRKDTELNETFLVYCENCCFDVKQGYQEARKALNYIPLLKYY